MIDSSVELSRLSTDEKRELLTRLLREKAEFQELSYAQRAMWFLNELAPRSAAYNTGFAMRILSHADPEALTRAFQTLLNRHASLRTTFAIRGEQPIQQVHPTMVFNLQRIDAAGWNDAFLTDRVQNSLAQPFDLERGPLMRVSLFTRGPIDHVLLIAFHHVAFDGWSFWVLLDEFGLLCETDSQRSTGDSLPPLPAAYTDFVHSERKMLAGPDGNRHRAYWETQLAGDLPVLELPTDRTRPSRQLFEGKVLPFNVGKAMTEKLKERAAAEGCTLFTYLLAVYLVFLYRYSGQEEVIVGSPTTGRSRPEFSGVIGNFVNMVALRARLRDGMPFRDLVQQMRIVVLEALEHQEYPFPLLVEKLGSGRNASHAPVFQTSFVFHKPQVTGRLSGLVSPNEVGATVACGEMQLAPWPLSQQAGQFDLTLEIADAGDELACNLKYDTALFEDATAEPMTRHFVNLLSASIENPDRSIADLPMLSERERAQILDEWNATTVTYPQTTLSRLIEEQVRRTPGAAALVENGRAISYRELNRQANQLARRLRSLGVGPDILVGICMERSAEMVVGLLAILKAGGAYVPLDPAYPVERLAAMIEDANPRVVLTGASLSLHLPGCEERLLVVDLVSEEISGQSGEDLEGGAGPDHLAWVIYTSGSTGTPKGAMNTHRAVCNQLLWMQDEYPLTEADRVLQKTPFTFDVSVWEFFWPLMTGARIVMAKPDGHRDPAYLVSLIQQEGVTTLQFVPSMLQLFLEAEGVADCDSLRRVFCIGEALPGELQQRFFQSMSAELHNLYGPTETAVAVTYWACRRGREQKLVSIGRPLANTKIYILDGGRNLVPSGVRGEIYIGGVQVGRGYWKRPELTSERFVADPFSENPAARMYRTGDVGRWLEDGTIEYLGRNDFQVKIRGSRVELGEIEARLCEHAAVREAVVAAREGRPGDLQLVAYYTCPESEEHAGVDAEDLRNHLRGKLPEYMVPAAFLRMSQLPLTANGKLDRKALPAPESDAFLSRNFVPPANGLEQTLADIWSEVLGVENIGVHDNFFELGGHSLAAARLMARLRSALGADLPLQSLFIDPTIAGLASHMTYDDANRTWRYISEVPRWNCLVPAQPRGSRTPFFFVCGYQTPDDTLQVLSLLIPKIGLDQPVYGFRPRWVEGGHEEYQSVEELARDFLGELRAVQPSGPYLLGGHCVGGIAALEVAQLLIQQGEEVRLMLFLDTVRPSRWSALFNHLNVLWLRTQHIADTVSAILRPPQRTRRELIRNLTRRKLGGARSENERATDRLHQAKVNYRRLLFRHKPATYPGRITLITNEEQARFDRRLGWSRIPAGGLEVHVLPGDHNTILIQHWNEIARVMRRCIDRALGEPEGRAQEEEVAPV